MQVLHVVMLWVIAVINNGPNKNTSLFSTNVLFMQKPAKSSGMPRQVNKRIGHLRKTLTLSPIKLTGSNNISIMITDRRAQSPRVSDNFEAGACDKRSTPRCPLRRV
jgi:hypothetical protein